MFVARAFRSTPLVWLGLLLSSAFLLGCSAAVTPAPAAPPIAIAQDSALAPTAVSFTPAPPPTALPSAVPATSTPVLQITLITPTPLPTLPPAPTAAPQPTGQVISGTNPTGAKGGPTSVPRPAALGNTAADAALQRILRQCWNVSDTRQLNGNNPAHRSAFECARPLLLELAKNNTGYALVQRVLAWGYFYKDNDIARAISAYRAAAAIYKAQGDGAGESEARMRLALLLTSSSLGQACAELASASRVDPSNTRAADYYSAFNCRNAGGQAGAQGPAPAPAPNVDLATLRGKIVFKSDREGFPASYVMDADGKNVKRISGATYDAAEQWESWSPDRSQAATVRAAGYTRKFGYDNDIWITDPQGNGRPLTNPADDYDPAWSQVPLFDGRTWIVFVSNRGDVAHQDRQGEDLWVMHDDGTSPFRISCNAPWYSKHPSWAPDGKKIVFYSNQQGQRAQIYIMDVSAFGTLQDNCQMGQSPLNISQSSSSDSEPIWVK